MRAILIVDHGSRVAAANAQLVEIARLVERELGDGTMVRHAHMELGAPTIVDAIDALVDAGADDIVVHPYFLAPGRHASEDVPRLAHDAAGRHPTVRIHVTEPLGVHELLAKLVVLRCRE
jgi:sirohydrochlorin ferrochelatase